MNPQKNSLKSENHQPGAADDDRTGSDGSSRPRRAPMIESFDSIGFQVAGEDAIDQLAEYVDQSGERSSIYRHGAFMHGRCLRLGAGLEIWTILCETKSGLQMINCRPAFRSLRVYSISPWELTEGSAEAGGVVTGNLYGTSWEISFQLQNLTELSPDVFKLPYLHVSLAGLASGARARTSRQNACLAVGDKAEPIRGKYIARGALIDSRPVVNEVSGHQVLLMDIDIGLMNLEVLLDRSHLQGNPIKGRSYSADIWLQGYILDERELEARYEGPDRAAAQAQYWAKFRRDN